MQGEGEGEGQEPEQMAFIYHPFRSTEETEGTWTPFLFSGGTQLLHDPITDPTRDILGTSPEPVEAFHLRELLLKETQEVRKATRAKVRCTPRRSASSRSSRCSLLMMQRFSSASWQSDCLTFSSGTERQNSGCLEHTGVSKLLREATEPRGDLLMS